MNLLHLVHRFPYPPDKGDRIRSFHMLRYLAQRARVHLACLADEPVAPAALQALQQICASVTVVPNGGFQRWSRAAWSLATGRTVTAGAFASPELRRQLNRLTAETRFDFCLVSASSMIPYLQTPALRTLAAVVDLVDVDSQKWLDYASASSPPKAWLYRLEGQRLRRLEQSLPGWVHGVTLTTPFEVQLYEAFAGPGTALAIPNGVDLDYFQPRPPVTHPQCVFVGALDYKPNVDGIVWFCDAVWPQVRQACPQARLQVVGRKPTPAVQGLATRSGVEVIGTVPDVRPYIADSAVAIVPLRIARGVQNKVLEAMAMARPVVASPLCLQGLTTVTGRDLLAADTVDQWVAALGQLFADEQRRLALGTAARTFVEAHHSWERCLAPLWQLMAEVRT